MKKAIKNIIKSVLTKEQYNQLSDKLRIYNNKKIDNKKINEFHENFRAIMEESGIYVAYDKTITPYNFKVLNNGGADGIVCNLKFPKGLSVRDLDKAKKALAQTVYGKCMVFIEDIEEDIENPVRFSAIKQWHNIKYTPISQYKNKKLTASQLFIGYNINLEPIVIDLANNPHLLITGGSGGGKSKLVEIIITNLASCNTEDELHMYFLQVAKDDNFKFELLKHCKGCVTSTSGDSKYETFALTLAMLRHIDNERRRREKLVKERLGRKSEDSNIHIYNKKFKDKLSVIQLWVDEAASLYKKTSDNEINKMIAECQYILEQIASAGRYIGIYLINVLQRASKEELPREIKINTANWISFKQVDGSASKVAIGDETSAVGLPQRVFAYKAGKEYVSFAKTPYTRWDRNIEHLEEQDKIREDKQGIYDEAYSHWNDVSTRKNRESAKENQEDNRSKIISDVVKDYENKLIDANEKIYLLETKLKEKSDIINKLVEQNNKKTFEDMDSFLNSISTNEDNSTEDINNSDEYVALDLTNMPPFINKSKRSVE